MPNTIYKKLPDGSYLNQGYPGGPAAFRVQINPNAPTALTAYDWYFSFDASDFHPMGQGFPSQSTAQTGLDNYITTLINGTAGP